MFLKNTCAKKNNLNIEVITFRTTFLDIIYPKNIVDINMSSEAHLHLVVLFQ